MKAILIINPKSGQTKRKMPPILKWTFKKLEKRVIEVSELVTTAEEIIEEVQKSCVKENIKLDIEYTKHPKHAMELAKSAKNKYDIVIVAGGDGTVNEVINGIIGSKITLAIIPFGSTNVLALELGIPFNAKEASELIVQGKKLKIDLGYAKTNEEARYFSMMVGIGFIPKLIEGTDLKVKKRWGNLAYVLSGIRQLLTYKWHNIHVEHKSHSVGYFVIVSNSKDYGGEYQIADKASITDGFLDLVVINRKSWWKIIKFFSSVLIGRSNTFLRGEYYQIKEAHIYSRHKMLVQIDGELIGTVPVDVKVVPKALTVMVKR
ncbi:MAG: diacylglycerol/lipid kinase family protein [Candidatus Humimicrobiaceae bacterium]